MRQFDIFSDQRTLDVLADAALMMQSQPAPAQHTTVSSTLDARAAVSVLQSSTPLFSGASSIEALVTAVHQMSAPYAGRGAPGPQTAAVRPSTTLNLRQGRRRTYRDGYSDDDDEVEDAELKRLESASTGSGGNSPTFSRARGKAPRKVRTDDPSALTRMSGNSPRTSNSVKKKSSDLLIQQARGIVNSSSTLTDVFAHVDARAISSLDVCREIMTRLSSDGPNGKFRATPDDLVRVAINITARKHWPLLRQLTSIMGQLTDHHVRAIPHYRLTNMQIVSHAFDVAVRIKSTRDTAASVMEAIGQVMTADGMLKRLQCSEAQMMDMLGAEQEARASSHI